MSFVTDNYPSSSLAPYVYFPFSQSSDTISESGSATVTFSLSLYSSGWSGSINTPQSVFFINYYDENDNDLGWELHDPNSSVFTSSIGTSSGTITVNLANATSSLKLSAYRIRLQLPLTVTVTTPAGTGNRDSVIADSDCLAPTFVINHYTPPTITRQPSITSISPSSGTSTTVSWSAATVSNQGSATIYYQYFVGPSSTYSDSYHVGTTTGLSATITESDILNKCGSSFDGICYLFVRAYWQDGSTTGGWTTPTGSAFTYTAHRTVSYHDGSGWVECIVYYHDGSSWVECVPYYYSGGWIECSNS